MISVHQNNAPLTSEQSAQVGLGLPEGVPIPTCRIRRNAEYRIVCNLCNHDYKNVATFTAHFKPRPGGSQTRQRQSSGRSLGAGAIFAQDDSNACHSRQNLRRRQVASFLCRVKAQKQQLCGVPHAANVKGWLAWEYRVLLGDFFAAAKRAARTSMLLEFASFHR